MVAVMADSSLQILKTGKQIHNYITCGLAANYGTCSGILLKFQLNFNEGKAKILMLKNEIPLADEMNFIISALSC